MKRHPLKRTTRHYKEQRRREKRFSRLFSACGTREILSPPVQSGRKNREPIDVGARRVERVEAAGKERVAQAKKAGGKKRWSLDAFAVEPQPGKARFHDFSLPLSLMRAI